MAAGKVMGLICGFPRSLVVMVYNSCVKCSFSLEVRVEKDFSSPRWENYSLNSRSDRDSPSATCAATSSFITTFS